MAEPETIEAEAEEVLSQALEPYRQQLPSTLLEGSSPRAQLAHASEIAVALADIIDKQELYVQIGKKKHVVVEGWSMLGSILGVFPVTEWTRKTEDGWEARVVARTLSGAEVGAAEAQCTRLEKEWGPNPTRGRPRDDYALRSMAQTRATSKALRMPLGFVMTLAGYEATPLEEMPRDGGATEPQPTGGPAPLRKPTSWARLTELVSQWTELEHDDFVAFTRSASLLQYGAAESKDLTPAQKKELLSIAGDAALLLRTRFDPASFPPPSRDEIRAAWAVVLGGQELAHPDEITAEEVPE